MAYMVPVDRTLQRETMGMAKRLTVVQQAIFTTAETGRSADHRIVAASSGIAEFDRRELAVWGPSNDALLDSAPRP